MSNSTYAWFQCYGIEIEYMIVDRQSLCVRPISDLLLRDADGVIQSELEFDDMAWSNELLAHVIELKTNGPVGCLPGVAERFQDQVQRINQLLSNHDCQLMPTGMHPWMDPIGEKKLWQHDYHTVYETFDRIFNCSGHGWANLQSMHINLPFEGEQQFQVLHSAIRVLLPLLPAIAASSPIVERRATGLSDNRMEFYRNNSRKIPEIAGSVVPELITSIEQYQTQILKSIYDATAPYDPDGVLRFEWCNARGAITRFDRNAIEIRVIDAQECPAGDLAIAELVVAILKYLCEEKSKHITELSAATNLAFLSDLFLDSIRNADETEIANPDYLQVFGIEEKALNAGEFWSAMYQRHEGQLSDAAQSHWQVLLEEGPLAKRILQAVGPQLQNLQQVYGQLCDCLRDGVAFRSNPG